MGMISISPPVNSQLTIHHLRRRAWFVGGLVLMFLVLLGSSAAGQESSPPLVVDADEVIYDQATQTVVAAGNVRLSYRGVRLSADRVTVDLRTERMVASGHVVLVDPQGRELRGETLTYDARLDQAELTKTEAIVNRVFVRSERLERTPQRILAEQAMLTTCDPARPAYRVTAESVEIIPGDRIVARRASLWIGSVRLFTLPVYVISLASAEETARSFPRVGYNNVDGFYAEYPYRYHLGPVLGELIAKYGTRSGIIARNITRHRAGPFDLSLTVGRNQDSEFRIFDQAETAMAVQSQVGAAPHVVFGSLSAGWFRQALTDVSASRLQYLLGARTMLPIPLAPALSLQAAASWQSAFYGTGDRQHVVRIDADLTRQLTVNSTLTLGYKLVEVIGATPFLFDSVELEDQLHRLTLQYGQSGRRGALETRVGAGTTYYFRDPLATINPGIAANLGYGERLPERYHWWLSGEYNLATRALKVTTDSGLSLGRGTYLTVQAIYNTTTRLFEDLDAIFAARLCDCIDVSLKYRHVRQEIWFEVGLAAFPELRLQQLVTSP